MAVRGAPAIGAAGAFAMALSLLQDEDEGRGADSEGKLRKLREAKRVLDDSRPTAVNLSWATSRILAVAESVDAEFGVLLSEAKALALEDIEANRRLGAFGCELIGQGWNLVHHCNTGHLATAGFGTALGIVYACQEAGKEIHVWVDETRPRLQGARLTAWELQKCGVQMHLVADGVAGHLMQRGKVDAAVFGADRVARNGDVANKIGTYALAVVAKENGVPNFAAVPTSSIDLQIMTGEEIVIEERDAEEVTEIGGVRIAPQGVQVYNPAFDVTPAKYLTAIVTEEGVCYPPFEISLPDAVARAKERMIKSREARIEAYLLQKKLL